MVSPHVRFPCRSPPWRRSRDSVTTGSTVFSRRCLRSLRLELRLLREALMLDHLGHPKAGEAIVHAIEAVLDPKSGAPRTPDIGGKAKTSDLGKAIAEAL